MVSQTEFTPCKTETSPPHGPRRRKNRCLPPAVRLSNSQLKGVFSDSLPGKARGAMSLSLRAHAHRAAPEGHSTRSPLRCTSPRIEDNRWSMLALCCPRAPWRFNTAARNEKATTPRSSTDCCGNAEIINSRCSEPPRADLNSQPGSESWRRPKASAPDMAWVKPLLPPPCSSQGASGISGCAKLATIRGDCNPCEPLTVCIGISLWGSRQQYRKPTA